ncbi:MAG: Uncharacterized protein G01um10145_548 [Microgenomates group bacterium Gr01-1014_5]|nr:MAG: Uncharacterized protein G01um10145_548 [Microgenomates group bacterium Gr01-1014_5]
MKLTLPKIRLYTIILILIVVSFGGGVWLGKRDVSLQAEGLKSKITISRNIPERHADVDFNLFWEVWDRLEGSYFDKSKVDKAKMVYGAISGMVSAVGDPYTVFLPPEEQKRTKEDLGGEFEGVGIQIGFKGTQLAVIAPLEGTPAFKADVKAGDYIVGIKDKNKNLELGTVGVSLPDAVNAIRGPAGTAVALILTREGVDKPFEVEIVREKIDVPSVILTKEGEISHLKLLKFGDQTDGEWDKAIANIKKQNPKGLILDLRNNPGGYLNGAVTVAGEFITRGNAVLREDSKGTRTGIAVNGKGQLINTPLVVLVNKGSASASEIVAGALKDYGRAKIVGTKTFGKGTIQESIDLGEAGIHITTERWLTPNGTWVNTVGLTPDVEVEDDVKTEEDEQVEAALQLLK